MIVGSYILAILPLVITLTTLAFSIIYVYLVLVVIFCAYLVYDLIRERNFEDSLLGEFTSKTTTDEDRYWRYAVYNNPSD